MQPIYKESLITGPAEELVTRNEAKTAAQIDLDITDQDTYIDDLIVAARRTIENFTNRALLPQTWLKAWDCFPYCDELEIDHGNLISVTHLKYYDENNQLQTINSNQYEIDTLSEPGRVVLVDGISWPTTKYRKPNAVQLTYVAGYSNKAAVPKELKVALLSTVTYWFNNREPVALQYSVARKLPFYIENMLHSYVLRRF